MATFNAASDIPIRLRTPFDRQHPDNFIINSLNASVVPLVLRARVQPHIIETLPSLEGPEAYMMLGEVANVDDGGRVAGLLNM